MNEEYRKIEKIVGNDNKYQKVTLLVSILVWISSFTLIISLPFLQKMPRVTYYDINTKTQITSDLTYKICEEYKDNYQIFEYDKFSWVYEFKIHCDSMMTGLISSSMALGLVIGGILQIVIVDYLGRRKLLVLSMIIYCILLFVISFTNNDNITVYTLYALIFSSNIFSSSCLLSVYLYVSEINFGANRAVYSGIINSAFSLGTIISIFIYYFFESNKVNFSVSFVMGLLSTGLILFIFYETPKFYFIKGLFSKFLVSFSNIARFNGNHETYEKYLDKNIGRLEKVFYYEEIDDRRSNSDITGFNGDPHVTHSPNLTLNFKSFANDSFIGHNNENGENGNEDGIGANNEIPDLRERLNKVYKNEPNSTIVSEKDYEKKYKLKVRERTIYSALDLLRYKSQRSIFLKLCFTWFTISFIYFGLRTDMRKMNEKVYTVELISNCMEFVVFILAGFLINLKIFGRVRLMFILLIISFVGLLFVTCYNTQNFLEHVMLMMVDFSIAGIFLIIYIYSFEVYPICISAKGFSLNFVIGRIGVVASNMMVEVLAEKLYFLIVMTILNFACIFTIFHLPDTLGIETLEEIPEITEESRNL